jgi:hypothetical protein
MNIHKSLSGSKTSTSESIPNQSISKGWTQQAPPQSNVYQTISATGAGTGKQITRKPSGSSTNPKVNQTIHMSQSGPSPFQDESYDQGHQGRSQSNNPYLLENQKHKSVK